MNTPVAFIIFIRPEVTAISFERIRAARPKTLIVIADGPRADRPGEAEKCRITRKIIEKVDWPCEVITDFSDVNLGPKVRISSGIDNVFAKFEEAIFIEDDCIVDPSFFRFAEEMLARYRHDPKVMMISSINKLKGKQKIPYSYSFSKFAHIWGWASWRRAWAPHYDVNIKSWPEYRDSRELERYLNHRGMTRFWTQCLERNHQGLIDTWDEQWTYSMLKNKGLCVMPAVNLVRNQGFGEEAAHTKTLNSLATLRESTMPFPLVHPPEVIADEAADRAMHRQRTNIASKIYYKIFGRFLQT